MVVTSRGPLSLQDAFELGETRRMNPDGDISFPSDLKAVTGSGQLRDVKGVFRHPYKGEVIKVKPYYLPSVTCTPDHRVYATDDVSKPPELIHAKHLTKKHYLAVPRSFAFSSSQAIDAQYLLGSHQIAFQIPWKVSGEDMQQIMDLSALGKTSREIGEMFGKSGSYIRHLRSKIKNGKVQATKISNPYIEEGYLRFPNERQPGIPVITEFGVEVAELFGYYCSEGSIVTDTTRPNSFKINFSFSKNETEFASRVVELLHMCFGVSARLVNRQTTLAVSASKSSLAVLLKTLAGERSTSKRVPKMLFDAPREVIEAFLSAYVQGDGHRFANGKISSTTVSKDLAYGIAWLALKCGYFPSIYDASIPETGMIEGRVVTRAPHQYTVVWYED